MTQKIWFVDHSSGDLAQVADAISQFRLTAPFTTVGLARLGVSDPHTIASQLNALADNGFQAPQLSIFLHTIASERTYSNERATELELVITGPDVREQARDTAVVVEQLFGEAKRSVLVVGFALHKGDLIFRRLAERLDATPGLDATLCLDVSRRGTDTTRDADLVARYSIEFVEKHWSGKRLPKVYFDPRGLTLETSIRAVLHAKCIVVDGESALITSANPTPAAYTRNIELGVVVRGGTIAGQVSNHFTSLIEAGILRRLPLPTQC